MSGDGAVKPVMNIADVPLRDNAHGETFQARIGSFGRTIGPTGIGVTLHMVEPGKAAFAGLGCRLILY